jgi:cytochrome c5
LQWIVRILIILASLGITALCFAALSGSLSETKIIDRIKPIGEVNVEAGGTAQAEKTVNTAILDIGQNRYEQTCKMCHETGLADAPKLGDKAAWKPRIDQGMETLIKHALHGLKAMPPKGGCVSCSDEEIQKAVEYMVSKSK